MDVKTGLSVRGNHSNYPRIRRTDAPFQYPLSPKKSSKRAGNCKLSAAGVGVDNIDVPAATRQGIIVVNSPEGNTIALPNTPLP
ncbi:MAG UNVERIFIED_CONTAM: hypothetical protein LVR29_25620 [Microcystis novacekii LVE1205-3]